MSFVFFTDTPQYKPRGIKVDLPYKKSPKFNLSWGIQPDYNPHMPIINKSTQQKRQLNKFADSDLRVMNDNNQQQLDKLLKRFKDGRNPKYSYSTKKDDKNNIYSNKNIIHKNEKLKTSQSQNQDLSVSRMQGQLIKNKIDTVKIILDPQNNRMHSLQESRISRRFTVGNKKNQSFVEFGDGFNPFLPEKNQKKSIDQKLKEMYLYQESLKKRQEKNLGIIY